MIKGFFFDLDGTLVDTHQANFQAYKRALTEFGVEIDFADFQKTIGFQAQTFLPWLAPDLSSDDYHQIAKHKAEHYKDLMHLTKLNEGLVNFMALMAGEHQLVLVTTAKQANAIAVLKHHKLTKYFDHVITAEDVTESKPAPEAYLLALQKTGLQSAEVVAFEDSKAGLQSAEAAGIAAVLIKEFTP